MIKAIHQYLSVKQYSLDISFDGGGDDGGQTRMSHLISYHNSSRPRWAVSKCTDGLFWGL